MVQKHLDRLYLILPGFAQNLLSTEFFKYCISGAIAFICDFGILVIGTEVFGIHYLISNIGGYAAGLIVSYTINITWVFEHRRFGHASHKEFFFFVIIVFVGLGISEAIIYIVTEHMGVVYTLSKVVSILFVFLFNFVVKKAFLFSPASDEKTG